MKETTSLTLKESAAFLGANDYLRDVAILVIAYGTSINIVEGGWWCHVPMGRQADVDDDDGVSRNGGGKFSVDNDGLRCLCLVQLVLDDER